MVPEGNNPGHRPVRNNLRTSRALPSSTLPPAASNAVDALGGYNLLAQVLELLPLLPQSAPPREDEGPRSCTDCTLFPPVESDRIREERAGIRQLAP
jgi:hypothetical protein